MAFNEDFHSSDETLPVRTDSDTHIGISKKTGGWLEEEIEKILKYAGFDTTREQTVIYEDSSGDHYRVDVIGKIANLTLFVECKDYEESKVNPKILFTLIGQVHDYRRNNPNEHVIGILATSAKNIGQNEGVASKLQREGCYLWDGLMINKLQTMMMEVETKTEFTTFLLQEIEYIQSIAAETSKLHEPQYLREKLQSNEHRFDCRLEFFTITAQEYVGNDFSYLAFEKDLQQIVENTKLELTSFRYKEEGDENPYFHCVVDFKMIKTSEQINTHWKSKCKFFKKPEIPPMELMKMHFLEACMKAVSKTYGVQNGFVEKKTNCLGIRME